MIDDTTCATVVATTVETASAQLPTVNCQLPTEQDLVLFRQQYQRAIDGLYEAWKFGAMLAKIKEALEGDAGACAAAELAVGSGQLAVAEGGVYAPTPPTSPGVLTRENARIEQAHGGALATGGWNAGLGLKTWLAEACPEVNYKTAMRFLAVARRVTESLGEAASETEVRAFLEGKSQRGLLNSNGAPRLGGAREGAGRPVKNYAEAMDASGAVAWRELEEPLQALSELIIAQKRHERLSAVDFATLKNTIDMIHEIIHSAEMN